MIEPRTEIPEEQDQAIITEQRFVEEAEKEESPKKLRVRMETKASAYGSNDPQKSTFQPVEYPPNQSSPHRMLRFSSSDPVYTEKLGIRKNFDDYEPYKPDDPFIFSKQVFQDLELGDHKDKEALLGRLQERYEKIYRENYLIDRNDNRRYHTNELYPGMSRATGGHEVPFMTDESIRDS